MDTKELRANLCPALRPGGDSVVPARSLAGGHGQGLLQGSFFQPSEVN